MALGLGFGFVLGFFGSMTMKLKLLVSTVAILACPAAYAEANPDQRLWSCIGMFDAAATAEKEAHRTLLYKNFQAISALAQTVALKANPDLPQATRDELQKLSQQARSQSLVLFRTGRTVDAYSEILGCYKDLVRFSEDNGIEIGS